MWLIEVIICSLWTVAAFWAGSKYKTWPALRKAMKEKIDELK